MIVLKALAALEAANECHRLMQEAVGSHPRRNEHWPCECYCCRAKQEALTLVKTITASIEFGRQIAAEFREEDLHE